MAACLRCLPGLLGPHRLRPAARGRAVIEASRGAAQAFLADLPGTPGPVAAVARGGITTDLLRNLLGDDALRPEVLGAGIPPCAITAVDDLNVVTIASVSHPR